MEITPSQIVYALTFIFVIFAVEGVYLLLMSRNDRERIVNRRMQLVHKHESRNLDPSILKREAQGGAISNFLLGASPSLGNLLWAADVRMSPAGFMGLCVAAGGLTLLFGQYVLGLSFQFSLLLAGLTGFCAPFLFLLSSKAKRQKAFAEQLPSAIDLITRGLQAGHPVPVALEMVAREMPDPIGSEFGAAIDQINYGLDRDAAMRGVIAHFPNPDFRFLVAALEMQRETGGNLVDVLTKLSEVIRARANMRKKVSALSAEGRLTAFVVGGLPFIVAVVINLINPGYYSQVIDHPMFLPQMGFAVLLWFIGIYMIWKLVNFKI
mgnify:CR=1 FL=1